MRRTIYKYELTAHTVGDTTILVPAKSLILAAGAQFPSRVVVWVEQAIPSDDTKLVPRLIREFWTGQPLTVRTPYNLLKFIGTVQAPDTGIVTHIYEEVAP